MSEENPLLDEQDPFRKKSDEATTGGKSQIPRSSLLLHDFILAAKLNDAAALHVLNVSILQNMNQNGSSHQEKQHSRRGNSLPAQHSYPEVEFPRINDLEDVDGWTPLHSACESRCPSTVAYLLAAGCSPNRPARDTYGCMTPMHLACFRGHPEVVQRMVAAGGTLLSPATTTGLIPIDLASYTAFPCQDLVDAIEKHSGMKVTFEDSDSTVIHPGPKLVGKRYYSLRKSDEHQKYRIASEGEIQETIFIGETPGVPLRPRKVADAAGALVDFYQSTPIRRDRHSTAERARQVTPHVDHGCPDADLSDSFSELMASREEYMSTPQHATNILDSEAISGANKENTPQGKLIVPRSGAGQTDTPLKKTPIEPADPDMSPLKKPTRPLPKTKHARFAPGIQSPVRIRASGRRPQVVHPVSSLRRALSDITPPQVSTPTAKARPVSKPPTPWPKLPGKEVMAKKLDRFHLSLSPSDEKENQHLKPFAKVEFAAKSRTKRSGYKRLAFQERKEENC